MSEDRTQISFGCVGVPGLLLVWKTATRGKCLATTVFSGPRNGDYYCFGKIADTSVACESVM